MKITITGASDDLIEIGGDIVEEWYMLGEVPDEGGLIAVSDGTLIRVRYDRDGIWRFNTLVRGQCECSKVEGEVEKDSFDTVTLVGEIKWIALANQYATAKG